MRGYIRLLLLLIFYFGITLGCSNKTVKPESPENTTWLMKSAIDNDDYVSFNSLFSDGRKGSISESDFKELKKMTSASAGYIRYELVTFDNGEMLLVRLTPPDGDNEIEIEDVIVVPDSMKELFNDSFPIDQIHTLQYPTPDFSLLFQHRLDRLHQHTYGKDL